MAAVIRLLHIIQRTGSLQQEPVPRRGLRYHKDPPVSGSVRRARWELEEAGLPLLSLPLRHRRLPELRRGASRNRRPPPKLLLSNLPALSNLPPVPLQTQKNVNLFSSSLFYCYMHTNVNDASLSQMESRGNATYLIVKQ